MIDYIQGQGDYWIDTFGNISRYMRERLNSTIQVIAENHSEIRLQVIMDIRIACVFLERFIDHQEHCSTFLGAGNGGTRKLHRNYNLCN